MSFWDELKELLYKPVKQDSRNFEKLGQMWNIPYLEQEGNRNVDNPGRAVGKAAGAAASWYLGGLLGGTGAASNAGSAIGAGAGAGGSAAANIGAGALTASQSQILSSIAQDPNMWSGLLSQFGSNMGDERTQQMMKMGSGLLDGGQQQPQPMAPPPQQQQQQQEPLSMPYTNSLQGPPPGMTREEWERLKRQRGLLGGM